MIRQLKHAIRRHSKSSHLRLPGETLQAGAGIVADSVPESEYQECLNKTRALIRAVELARSGE